MTTKHETSTVHFSIDGAFVLNLRREEAVYGSWKKAINMLLNSFEGMSHDHAIALLKGDKALIGWNNDIEMIDETPENRKQLTDEYIYQYEDVLFHQDQYYKPVYWMKPGAPCHSYVNDKFHGGAFSYENKPVGSDVEMASFWMHDVSNYHLTSHTQESNGHLFLVAWEKTSKIPPLWFKDETDPNKIIKRRIMNNTFYRISELDDGCVRQRFQHYVDEYSRPSIAQIACDKLSSLAQDGLLKKMKLEAENQAMDEKERAVEIDRLHNEIWNQNGESDFVVLADHKIPRKPLEGWALCRTKAMHLAAPWKEVSDTGWKMYGDNPLHTDWVIGAGIDPDDIYDSKKEVNDAATKWAFDFQIKMTNGDIAVLVPTRKSELTDVISHPSPNETIRSSIVVIPDCSTKWINVAKQIGKVGGIIIAQSGGQMSHLVMNGDEYGATILLHPKANEIFPPSCYVTINPENQTYTFPNKSTQELMTDAAMRS